LNKQIVRDYLEELDAAGRPVHQYHPARMRILGVSGEDPRSSLTRRNIRRRGLEPGEDEVGQLADHLGARLRR
jgi:hypothetical protein